MKGMNKDAGVRDNRPPPVSLFSLKLNAQRCEFTRAATINKHADSRVPHVVSPKLEDYSEGITNAKW